MKTNPQIMIVEDDQIAAAYLKKLLYNNDLTVCNISDNAIDALEKCKEEKPCLILMDIMIKGAISGCELAMQIRQFNTKVIIIFITAYTSEEMIEYALDAKAYSYLLKPYRDVEIISTVKMALKVHRHKIQTDDVILCKNGFSLQVKEKKIYQYKQEIFLSEKMHTLLYNLMLQRGNALSYEALSQMLWLDKGNINTLRSTISRLKVQLPDLELHNVSKSGYVVY